MDTAKGFTFSEIGITRASSSKVVCCHFSLDGKLLATGDHDKKAVLWHADTLKLKSASGEHSSLITDVRFSPSMLRLATSSFDKTVRVWDVDSPKYSLRTFTGHSSSVMSVDFHPIKEDLLCSCDIDGEIRYWSINNGSCTRVFKGGMTQVRFQPRMGRYLAATAENIVTILDVETQSCRHSLQGHTKKVYWLCWDPSGELVASVSEDSVRVWSLASGSEGECVHELSCNGNKFYSCIFHPTHPSLLVIGCNQIAKELMYMHERGISHMDVKPDNIYVKNGIYKLGDFGCATLLDKSLPIEEGDARYMPRELLNDTFEHSDKVDVFSLGATAYEHVKGSPLPDSGPQLSYLREGKIALLPGISMQLQCLLKAMMDPDPAKRPSAKEIIENPIFEKGCKFFC